MGKRMQKVLKCDGAAEPKATIADAGPGSRNLPLEPCNRTATAWVPETRRAYCDYHKEERGVLRQISGIPSGVFAEALGYAGYFALTAAFALPAFAFLPGARRWIGSERR